MSFLQQRTTSFIDMRHATCDLRPLPPQHLKAQSSKLEWLREQVKKAQLSE
jgi:hypothetical protein